MLENKTIGFIGCGQMGGAILSGALASGKVDAGKVFVTTRSAERLSTLEQEYGVHTVVNDGENSGAKAVFRQCDAVILAVKPQYARPILEAVRGDARPGQLVISILGGVTLALLGEFFPENPCLRVMPNTPMQVRQGVAGIAANARAGQAEQDFAVALFSLVGEAFLLPENLMDALTSVSGCGPAYAYLFIEAMADGAVEKGLPRAMAQRLAAQTLAGSAQMVLQTGKHPGELKDSVCSPAGGTIAGVHALERGAFRNTVMNAVTESCDRMIEVGKKA